MDSATKSASLASGNENGLARIQGEVFMAAGAVARVPGCAWDDVLSGVFDYLGFDSAAPEPNAQASSCGPRPIKAGCDSFPVADAPGSLGMQHWRDTGSRPYRPVADALGSL